MKFENTNDYTRVAPFFDMTRNIPVGLLKECYRRIFQQTGFPERAKILDAGCGTGQLSAPLIADGYSVIGVDVSEAMLEVARSKVKSGADVLYEVADVRSMKYPDDTFDATVVSKLFQHVGNWKLAVDEILRVTKNGGLFIHINETGAFKNAVRKRFQELCQARGYTDLYIGIIDRSQLGVYLQEQGTRPVTIETQDLSWIKEFIYKDAFNHLRLKLLAEFWPVPDEVYQDILETVREWMVAQPRGEDTVEVMYPHLKAEVFKVRK